MSTQWYTTGAEPQEELQPIDPEHIPQALRARRQWANWRGDKVLYNSRTGGSASSTAPSTWSSFEQAYRRDPARLVFVFAKDDGLVGFDVDHCRDPETGNLDRRGRAIMAIFPDVYWEISFGTDGLHGIGYGTLPIEESGKHPEGLGVFQHSRYFVMTGNTVPGHETLGTFGDDLEPWFHETFPEPVRPATPSQPIIITLDDLDIIRALEREQGESGNLARRLLAGDNTGYDDYSKPRWVLAMKCCFYTDDPAQVERILHKSGLFKPSDDDKQRDHVARHDAYKAVEEYNGPRYGGRSIPENPSDHHGLHDAAQVNDDIDAMPCGEAKVQLKAALAQNAQLEAQAVEKDARIAAQARMIRYERGRVRDIETILASTEVDAGARLAAVGVYLELDHQERKGTPKSKHGWQIPAVWIARRTGMTVKTANRQLQTLHAAQLVKRNVVSLSKGEQAVDNDTGEIFIVDVPRKAGFIETSPSAIVTNFTEYKRNAEAEAAKHGGKREPRCPQHPDAKVVRKWTDHCSICNKVLDTSEDASYRKRHADHAEQESEALAPTGTDGTPKMGSPIGSVTESLDVPKMGSPRSISPEHPMMGTSPLSNPQHLLPPDPDLDARFVANGWK